MTRTWLRVAGLMLAALASSRSLPAQTAKLDRQGMWWGVGVGAGMNRLGCNICRGSREISYSATGQLGGTVGRGLRLGAEVTGWLKSDTTSDVSKRLGVVSGVLLWSPARGRIPYFIKGGAGLILYRAKDRTVPDGQDPDRVTSTAFQGQFGVGYEFPIGTRWAFSPFLNFVGSFFSQLRFNGTDLTKGNITFIQLGASVTHF